jgi:hypothetical protein
MERGVLWGGLLISGSFLLAVMLNQAAREPRVSAPAPVVAVDDGRAGSVDARCRQANGAARDREAVRRSSDCREKGVSPQSAP